MRLFLKFMRSKGILTREPAALPMKPLTEKQLPNQLFFFSFEP
jgi:hypothetical protein